MSVQGSIAFLKFVVIDHKDNDILLGLNLFELTDCGIYPGRKLLKFPKSPNYVFNEPKENELDESIIDLCLADIPDELDIDNDISWELDQQVEIKPASKLVAKQTKLFNGLVTKIKGNVAHSLKDLGKCNIVKHKIKTLDEDPIYVPTYRKSQSEREQINKQVDELFQAGFLRSSKSPWSSPIVLVPKPNNYVWTIAVLIK